MLRDRLIFGTARLAGGAYARSSRRLIETCLNAGITRFDTAPSYGLGAAEALLGEVTSDLPYVAIHTKAGSIRHAHPALLGWAKVGRQLLPKRAPLGEACIVPYAGPAAGMNYRPEALAGSIARSLDLLRRERVDLLLLHEAEPFDLPEDAWQVLADAVASGQASALGFAHFGPARQRAPGLTVQTAPWPRDFLQAEPGQPRIFHSLAKAARVFSRERAVLAETLARTRDSLGLAGTGAAGDYVAAMVALGRVWPRAGLIFATTSEARLGHFLALLDRAEAAGLLCGIPT